MGPIPQTGTDADAVALAGLASILLGALLVLAGRRLGRRA